MPKFEECIQRLEKIVQQLEQGDVPLEKSLTLFEEGMQLSGSCRKELEEAEGKVGAPIKIAGFVRYALGEGIDKQESDFAAEVAAASGQKKPPGEPETGA